MILDDLLSPREWAEFMDRFYLKHPFACAGGCRHLVGASGWRLVEAILAQTRVDALAVRGAEVWPGGVPAAGQARDLLADGYTIRVRHAERHDPGLGALAEGFGRAFAAPVDVHLYCTPAGRPGLHWHYDAEEVFVLQTAGSKEWFVRKNTVHPWPLAEAIPADQRADREVAPVMRCELRGGDWLYVPSGHWHRTQAGEESISLSVGVLAAAAIEVYDWLRRELLDALVWRQRLPPVGEASGADPEDLVRRYKSILTELGRDVADRLAREEAARAFLTSRERHGG